MDKMSIALHQLIDVFCFFFLEVYLKLVSGLAIHRLAGEAILKPIATLATPLLIPVGAMPISLALLPLP